MYKFIFIHLYFSKQKYMNKLNYYNYNYIINVIKEKNGEKYLAYFFYTITIILSFVFFLPGKKDKIPIILKIYIPLCLFIITISLIIYYYVEQHKINQMIVNKIEQNENKIEKNEIDKYKDEIESRAMLNYSINLWSSIVLGILSIILLYVVGKFENKE